MNNSSTNLNLSTTSKIDYNELINQYLESTDDQAMDTIYLKFYYSFKQLQCCYQSQIVTLVYNYLLKITETTNATYIFNILNFTHRFIIDYEALIDLTLLGQQRHKSRDHFIYFSDEKMKSFIKIFVKEGDQIFPFYVGQNNYVSDIALALGAFYKTEYENIYLYYENQLINQNYLISQYNIKSGETFNAIAQKAETYNYSDSFLSLKINNNEGLFYYILMIIKEDNHYSFLTPEQFKKISKIAWKLLKVIPSYPQLLKDFTNTDFAIETFNNEKSELYRRYILQILLKKYQDNPKKTDIGKYSLELIIQKKLSDNELLDAFQIAIFYLQKSNKINFEQNLIYIINNIVVDTQNPKVSQSALNLFIEIKKYSETEKFILKQKEFLIKIMRKAKCDVEPFFKSFRKHTELFDILKDLVQEFSNNPEMLKRLFRVLKNLINSSCDTKETFKFVLENIKKVEADILIEYLEFFWRCLDVQPQLLSTTTTNSESLSIIDYLYNFIMNIKSCNDDTNFNLEDFKKYERQLRDSSIKIFIILCKNDDSIKKGIIKKMENMSTITCIHWNYSPEAFKRNNNGYCGLRNLGSTCYMNSIFQQLYFNSDFRTSLLSYQQENKFVQQIRNIFIRLALSNQASVDTQAFAKVWEVEDPQFSVRYQEDANEFFHKIIGKLPSEITHTFIGKQTRKFEGTQVQFNKVINELFNTIQLQVNGYSSFEESLTDAFKPQIKTGDDYRDEKLGNIDVKMTIEVETLPKTIVFLLERFDYNKQTSCRVKITNEFSFPLSFNADKYFPGQSGFYYLKGVITHSGTIDGGHYISLIRHGDDWINFDDTESRNISNNEYIDFVRGNKNLENAKCAYLLFYETRSVENENPNISSTIKQYLLHEEIEKITNENNNFSRTQAAFDRSTAEFALNSNDLSFTIHYFINVLCHSYMKDLSDSFSNKILKYINEKTSNAQIITTYLHESQELIFDITKCAPKEFNNSILAILSQLFQNVDYLSPLSIVDYIVKNLKDSISAWRTVPILAQIIYSYIKIDDDHSRVGSQKKWGIQILSYVETFYKSLLKQIQLENVDFSYLFKSLEIFFHSMDAKLLKSFVTNYGQKIEESKVREHLDAFLSLKDMIYGVKQAQSAASDPQEFCSYIVTLNESELVIQSIEKCNKPKSWILDAMAKNASIVKPTLLKFKTQVLFPLLTDKEEVNRKEAEKLVYSLFSDIPKLENYQNAELLYNGRSYVNVIDRSTAEKSNKKLISTEISKLKKQKKMRSSFQLLKEIKKKFKMKDSIVFYNNKEANEFLDSALEFIGMNCSSLVDRMSNIFRVIHWLKVRLNNKNISNLKEILNLIGVQRTNPNIDLIELFHLYQTFTEEQFDTFFKENNILIMHSLCPNFENVVLTDRIARFIMFISLISSHEQYIMCFKSDYFFPAYSFLIECPLPQPFCYMIAKFCSLLSHSNQKKKKKEVESEQDDEDDFDYNIDNKQLSNPIEIDSSEIVFDDNEIEDEDEQNRKNEEEDEKEDDVDDDNDNEIGELINGYHDDNDLNNKNQDDELNQDDMNLILNFAEFIGNHAGYSFFTPQTRDKEAVFIRILNKIKEYFTPELTSIYINQYFLVYDYFCSHPNLNDFTNLILSLPKIDQYKVNREMAFEIVSKNFKRIFLEKKEFYKLLVNLVSASPEFADAFANEFELYVLQKDQYKIEGDEKTIKKKLIENKNVWNLAEVYMHCALNGLKGERMLFIVCNFFESSTNTNSCIKFAKSEKGKSCIQMITSIMRQNDPNINQDDFFNATIEFFGFLTGNQIPIEKEVEDFLITYLENLEIYDLDVESLAESINNSSPGFEYSLELLTVYFKAKNGLKEYFLKNFPISQDVIDKWPPKFDKYRDLFIM